MAGKPCLTQPPPRSRGVLAPLHLLPLLPSPAALGASAAPVQRPEERAELGPALGCWDCERWAVCGAQGPECGQLDHKQGLLRTLT